MPSAADLATAVRRAVDDTPYMVADETPDGFTVQIDVVDAQWWTLMRRKSLSKSFKHLVEVDAGTGTYQVTDRSVTVEWEAGADAGIGIPQPVLRGSIAGQQGIIREISFRKETGLTDDAQVGNVVDYVFSSAEGNRLIDGAASQLGLRKTMNGSAKVGLVVASVAIGGLLIAGVVVGVVALAGGFS